MTTSELLQVLRRSGPGPEALLVATAGIAEDELARLLATLLNAGCLGAEQAQGLIAALEDPGSVAVDPQVQALLEEVTRLEAEHDRRRAEQAELLPLLDRHRALEQSTAELQRRCDHLESELQALEDNAAEVERLAVRGIP